MTKLPRRLAPVTNSTTTASTTPDCSSNVSQLAAFLLQFFLGAGLLYYGWILWGVLYYVLAIALPCCFGCCAGVLKESKAAVVPGVMIFCSLLGSFVVWLVVLILIGVGDLGPKNGCAINRW